VIVGNIATPEAALFLVENGADGVKVGIDLNLYYTYRGGCRFHSSAVLEVAAALKGLSSSNS
jgi:IMP dehydrogenase